MSLVGSSPGNSSGSVRSRSSVPLFPPSATSSPTPRGHAYILPELSRRERNSSGDKFNNVSDFFMQTSRAVAQSMLPTSNSCPDLTRKRNSPVARVECERFDESTNTTRSTSTGEMPSTGKLVRHRVPLSVASNLSECSPRLTIQKRTTYRKKYIDHSHSPTDGNYSGVRKMDYTLDNSIPSARRPITHNGHVINTSSPVSSPAPPMRRAGQYSLTAVNEIPSGNRPRRKPESAPAARMVGRQTDVEKGVINNGMHRECSFSSLTTLKEAQDPQLARVLGSETRKLTERLATAPCPGNKAKDNEKTLIATPRKEKDAPMDDVGHPETEINGQVEEVSVPEGMSPDTFDRCVKWVIGVESAKSERTLDTIMLPSMHINGESR